MTNTVIFAEKITVFTTGIENDWSMVSIFKIKLFLNSKDYGKQCKHYPVTR